MNLKKIKDMRYTIVYLGIAILMLSENLVQAQTVSGQLTNLAKNTIELIGFNYNETVPLAKGNIDANGNFVLTYDKHYIGMALLTVQSSNIFLVLNGEPIVLKAEDFTQPTKINYIEGVTTQQFVSFAQAQSVRESAISAWDFLQPLYSNDKVLQQEKKVLKNINSEIARLKEAGVKHHNSLNEYSYLYWYISMRQLTNNVKKINNMNGENVVALRTQLSNINFGNKYFKTSGLFKELVEAQFNTIAVLQHDQETQQQIIKESINNLIAKVADNDEAMNSMGDILFNMFESFGLTTASEYLAFSLLERNTCELHDDLTNKLEGYRKLKIGNVAPNIRLNSTLSLQDINQTVLLVFGASWCDNCKNSLHTLENYASQWTTKGVKVVYISLDVNEQEYESFYGDVAIDVYSDFKGWDSVAAKKYHVFATPTYLLLDAQLKIIGKPINVYQANNMITSNF